MKVTSKKFVTEFSRCKQVKAELVSAVIAGYHEWIENELKDGACIALPFGKFEVKTNSYKGFEGKPARKKRLRFSAYPSFREKIDRD